MEIEYRNWKDARKPKKKDNIVYYAQVSYEVLVGLGKKRKYKPFEDYAVIFNGWAYLVSGGKKSIDGKRFWIAEKFDDKPEQIPNSLVAEIQEKIK